MKFITAAHKNHTVVALATILVVMAFWETWSSLAELWQKMDFPYSYGFLAMVLACHHIYKKRSLLEMSRFGIDWKGVIGLGLLSIIWLCSSFLQIQIVTQLILPAIFFTFIYTFFGYSTALRLLPVYLYLLFSIPVWDYLNTSLQNLTTIVASSVIELTGIAVYIDGNFISIPYGTFEVAGGCSGLRYLMCTLVLALFYSQQKQENSFTTCLKLFSVAILFALLANWIRVIVIILIGYTSEMQSSIVQDHDVFGWYVYIGTMIPAFFVLNWIEKSSKAASLEPTTSTENPPEAFSSISFLLVMVVIFSGPLIKFSHDLFAEANKSNFQLNTNSQIPGWSIHEAKSEWTPEFSGANTSQLNFVNGHQKITINMLYFNQETQGQELINSENRLANSNQWRIRSAHQHIKLPTSIPVNANIITSKKRKKLIFSFYRIGDEKYTSALRTKIAQLRLLLEPSLFQGLISYGVDCYSDCTQESIALSEFAQMYEYRGPVVEVSEVD